MLRVATPLRVCSADPARCVEPRRASFGIDVPIWSGLLRGVEVSQAVAGCAAGNPRRERVLASVVRRRIIGFSAERPFFRNEKALFA